MAAHSPIGASSYYRWKACPGSVKLSRGIVSRSSSYAEEGTRVHGIVAEVLTTGIWPKDLDEETKDSALVYVNTVLSESQAEENSILLIEKRFDLSSLYPGLFGTADCVIYRPGSKLLQVIDYKHGSGIPVEVLEDGVPNPQLMYYGLGALLTSDFLCEEVEILIVQPRCAHPDGPVRRHKMPSSVLLDFALELVDAAKKTEEENALIQPGGHCRFCPAAGICPSIHEKAIVLAREEFSPQLSYDPKKLSHILEWLPALEGWIHQVREFAYGEALHGRIPPGYKLVAKRPTRRWNNEDFLPEILTKEFGLKDHEIFTKVLKSPAQMEKVIPKEARSHLGKYIAAVSSGNALAPNSDKREPVLVDARDEFTLINESPSGSTPTTRNNTDNSDTLTTDELCVPWLFDKNKK